MKTSLTSGMVIFFALPLLSLAETDLSALNSESAKSLSQLQNATTDARIQFTNWEKSGKGKENGIISMVYRKIGVKNSIDIEVPELKVKTENEGQDMVVQGFGKMNLTRIIGQDQINFLLPEMDNLLKVFFALQANPYGRALSINTKLEDLKRQDGDVISFQTTIDLSLDPSKMPPQKNPADLPLKSAKVKLGFDVNSGFAFLARLEKNPLHASAQPVPLRVADLLERMLASIDKGAQKLMKR